MGQLGSDSNSKHHHSGQTRSLWMEVELPSFPRLEKNLEKDVSIIGAGIVGLTCAYTLAKEGKSVVVVDQGAIASGQTARTTAHLAWALDDRFSDLEKLFGLEGIRLAAESHAAAIDYIEKIVKEEEIACDFERVDGYLFTPPGESKDILDKEYQAIQKTGKTIDKVDKAPFGSSFDTGICLRFSNQAQFHILKYLQGLIKALLKYGVEIYCDTHVNSIQDGSPCLVKTDSDAQISSQSVIVATCTPINNRFIIHTKQAPYRSYVIAALIPAGAIPKALFWDTLDPYHYVRTQKHLSNPELEWLIIGGEDHKTGQDHSLDPTHDHYNALETWARERFPMMNQVEYRWSGQVFEPMDSLAFIGKNPTNRNIYIATGDSGNGMTHGTIAGILIPDLILGRENPWIELYDPSRKTLAAYDEFIHENANAIMQYKDWFTPSEAKKVEELPPNEGMILREGLQKIAVYKDEKSNVYVNSAFCTHLGGCVRWNAVEKSWDCPLHGSRFDGCGHVMTGPAINGLRPCHHKEEVK